MERMAIRNNYLEREKKNAIVIIIDIKRTIYSFKFDKFSLRSRLRINIIERLIVVPYISKITLITYTFLSGQFSWKIIQCNRVIVVSNTRFHPRRLQQAPTFSRPYLSSCINL